MSDQTEPTTSDTPLHEEVTAPATDPVVICPRCDGKGTKDEVDDADLACVLCDGDGRITLKGWILCPATNYLSSDDRKALAHIASFLDGYKAPEQIGCAVWDVAETIKRLAGATT